MKISTKGRYSLRFLIDLATNQGEGFVALKSIAERQGISKKYLEQIVSLLSANGLLVTNRGHMGGYRLSKLPKDITVADVLRATEGNFAPVECLQTEENTCVRKEFCPTLPVWKKLNEIISDYLEGVTLQDLLTQSQSI